MWTTCTTAIVFSCGQERIVETQLLIQDRKKTLF